MSNHQWIGVMGPVLWGPYFGRVLSGIKAKAQQSDFQVLAVQASPQDIYRYRIAGDRVHAAAEGSVWERILHERPGWNVSIAEKNHAVVLQNWGAFVLVPDSDGRTRFVIRSTISTRAIPVWAAAVNFSAFELPHFIMQRRMMLRIKELAERAREARG